MPMVTLPDMNCLVCTKIIITRGAKKFCSSKCYGVYKSEHLTDEEKQRLLNICVSKGFMNKKHSDESKQKMGKAREGKYSKEHYRKIGLKGCQELYLRKPTSIEKILYDYLILNGIVFEKQKKINNKFVVDAYIPSLNLIIEADGKYWHSLPKTMKKDRAENAYLTKCGFKLLRLSEEEIKSKSFTLNREEGV